MGSLVVVKHVVRIPRATENVFYVHLKGAISACIRYDKQEKQWILMRYIPLSEESCGNSLEVSRLEYLIETGWSDEQIRSALRIPSTYIKKSDIKESTLGGQQNERHGNS